jgi:hypothetical protein
LTFLLTQWHRANSSLENPAAWMVRGLFNSMAAANIAP